MHRISLEQIESIIFEKTKFIVDNETLDKVAESFRFLTSFSNGKIIYGINTGFGPMAQFRIENDELNQLQYNLIRNHACGMGKPLEKIYARSVLLARLNAFLQGHSGVSLNVVEKLVSFLDNDIVPEIFEHGGVGASGDLVQLAHLGLNLIGEGNVYQNGSRISASAALKDAGIEPLQLQLRDGLALINGTSCMTGIGAINLIYAYRLFNWSLPMTGSYSCMRCPSLHDYNAGNSASAFSNLVRCFDFASPLIAVSRHIRAASTSSSRRYTMPRSPQSSNRFESRSIASR